MAANFTIFLTRVTVDATISLLATHLDFNDGRVHLEHDLGARIDLGLRGGWRWAGEC